MDYRCSLLIIFFLLESPLLTICHITSYGPSIEYLTRNSEENRNLSLIEFQPYLSVLIPLVDNQAALNYDEATKHFKHFYHGEFEVYAPEGHGIMAVIQLLKLRTVFGEPNRCLDYIKLRDIESEADFEKVCGEVDSDDDEDLRPKSLVGNRHFIAHSGKMSVRISIVSVIIKSEWLPKLEKHSTERMIGLEISFTAFPLSPKNAKHNHSIVGVEPDSAIFHGCPNDTFMDYEGSRHQHVLRRCSVFVKDSCISERLFCDDIVQCGFDSIGFAQDERDCGKYRDEFPYGTENWTQFNGTRKVKPQTIVIKKPFELQLIHSLITVLGCLLGALCVIALTWWLYRVYCINRRNVLDSGPPPEKFDETCQKKQSIIQMLEERRNSLTSNEYCKY